MLRPEVAPRQAAAHAVGLTSIATGPAAAERPADARFASTAAEHTTTRTISSPGATRRNRRFDRAGIGVPGIGAELVGWSVSMVRPAVFPRPVARPGTAGGRRMTFW